MEWQQIHHDVLRTLADHGQPLEIADLARRLGSDQSPVAAASTQLVEAGLVSLTEQPFDELALADEGRKYASAPLPERVIVRVLQEQGGSAALTDIPNHCDLAQGQVGQSLRWLSQKNWARKDQDQLVLTDAGKALTDDPGPDEQLLLALADDQPHRGDELAAAGVPVEEGLKLLAKRKGFITAKQRTERHVAITKSGRGKLADGVDAKQSVTQLTPELLTDGAWRDVNLRPYDVKLAAKKEFPGKEHAFQRTLDKVRRVFLEMGFTEITSPWVESSFWDFDALFQPQDHPARDMQDTFYISNPASCQLPDEDLVARVKATHQNGGDTGSTGWQYRWNADMAKKPVLRTHTTAATIRALSKHAYNKPGKYFIIGPVFRRETVDYKHLPVFHQVDGIIVDPKASLSTLLGTLAAFYKKMGFPKIRFRPSFFPYTEPSAEVFLWLEERGEWVEMGGSGIFRPEVTLPVGVEQRVLAWGLGLERLAMMIHNLKAIGDLYFATMPWLREAPLCRS